MLHHTSWSLASRWSPHHHKTNTKSYYNVIFVDVRHFDSVNHQYLNIFVGYEIDQVKLVSVSVSEKQIMRDHTMSYEDTPRPGPRRRAQRLILGFTFYVDLSTYKTMG